MYKALVLLACLLIPITWGCSAEGHESKPAETDEPEQQTPVVVGYLPDYRLNAEQAEPLWLKPITDLIYFSLSLPDSGVFEAGVISEKHLKKLKALQGESGRRLLLCIGGWSRSDGFPAATATRAKRKALIESLLTICKTQGFDGVDYDWEFPKPGGESENYSALLIETAEEFHRAGLIVTVATHSKQDLGKHVYEAIDRVHLMCYDQGFPHSTMGHAKHEIREVIGHGCPAGKIVLGIPFYGRNKERDARSYGQLIEGKDVTPTTNEIDGYAFNGPALVERKTRFAVEKKLAGVMIWELTQDEPRQQPLLRAVAKGLQQDNQ